MFAFYVKRNSIHDFKKNDISSSISRWTQYLNSVHLQPLSSSTENQIIFHLNSNWNWAKIRNSKYFVIWIISNVMHIKTTVTLKIYMCITPQNIFGEGICIFARKIFLWYRRFNIILCKKYRKWIFQNNE